MNYLFLSTLQVIDKLDLSFFYVLSVPGDFGTASNKIPPSLGEISVTFVRDKLNNLIGHCNLLVLFVRVMRLSLISQSTII